jgi:uncharacterized delta-60 repeat protein
MAPRIRMVCSLLALLTSACFVTDTAGRNSSPRPAPTRPSAVAAPGSLDAAFGDGGRVISGWDGPVDVPYWDIEKAVYGRAFDVEIQNDGRILVIGARGYGDAFALARHDPDGSLDPSFGDSGILHTTFPDASAAFDGAIQEDGKIVAVGTAGKSVYASGWSEYPGRPGVAFALARYRPNGDLDSSFGSEGKVLTRFGPDGSAQANAVEILPGGGLVVAGSVGGSAGLARYLPDGSLDPSFSSDGKLLIRWVDRSSLERASDVAVTADEKIVVGGLACAGRRCSVVVGRYFADGSPDMSFGSGGATLVPARSDRVTDLVIQSDGKLVLGAGRSVYRFDPDGSLDDSFADDGTLSGVSASGVAVDTDGAVIVAGPSGPQPWLFAVCRFEPTGVEDPGFGDDGRATADFPGFLNTPFAVAIQPDGKIVAAGTTSDFNLDAAFAVARFLPV